MVSLKLALVFPGQGSQSVGMMRAYGDLPQPEFIGVRVLASDGLMRRGLAAVVRGHSQGPGRILTMDPQGYGRPVLRFGPPGGKKALKTLDFDFSF